MINFISRICWYWNLHKGHWGTFNFKLSHMTAEKLSIWWSDWLRQALKKENFRFHRTGLIIVLKKCHSNFILLYTHFWVKESAIVFLWTMTWQSKLSRFSPQICWIFSSGNILSNAGKFLLFWPYDITIGSGPSVSCGYYGWWMCLWPRPTWTTHLFSGFAPCNPL